MWTLSNLMTPGRQRSGYFRLTLFSSKWLKWDAHVIYYPHGTGIPRHCDPSPVKGYRHHRVNIILKKPRGGGVFNTIDPKAKLFLGRVVYFSPEHEHHLTECRGSGRMVISFGWLTAK